MPNIHLVSYPSISHSLRDKWILELCNKTDKQIPELLNTEIYLLASIITLEHQTVKDVFLPSSSTWEYITKIFSKHLKTLLRF